MNNLDKKTVKSFSDQWVKYDQSGLNDKEATKYLKVIFLYFHGKSLENREGLIWCGTGRWAKFVAPK